MTHICIAKLNIIGSDNGLLPGQRQAITWTNVGILLIGPLGTKVSEILSGIQIFSFKKMHLKMSFAKWRPFCLGLNVLMAWCNMVPGHNLNMNVDPEMCMQNWWISNHSIEFWMPFDILYSLAMLNVWRRVSGEISTPRYEIRTIPKPRKPSGNRYGIMFVRIMLCKHFLTFKVLPLLTKGIYLHYYIAPNWP